MPQLQHCLLVVVLQHPSNHNNGRSHSHSRPSSHFSSRSSSHSSSMQPSSMLKERALRWYNAGSRDRSRRSIPRDPCCSTNVQSGVLTVRMPWATSSQLCWGTGPVHRHT